MVIRLSVRTDGLVDASAAPAGCSARDAVGRLHFAHGLLGRFLRARVHHAPAAGRPRSSSPSSTRSGQADGEVDRRPADGRGRRPGRPRPGPGRGNRSPRRSPTPAPAPARRSAPLPGARPDCPSGRPGRPAPSPCARSARPLRPNPARACSLARASSSVGGQAAEHQHLGAQRHRHFVQARGTRLAGQVVDRDAHFDARCRPPGTATRSCRSGSRRCACRRHCRRGRWTRPARPISRRSA